MKRTFRFLCVVLALLALVPLTSCSKEPSVPPIEELLTENGGMKEPEIPEIPTLPELPEIPTIPQSDKKEEFSKTPLMAGIDVSKWQGDIDFAKLKEDGVEFVMVRLGFSGESGSPSLDPKFEQNIKGADENGILVGVYFYSQAKSEETAKKEAEFIVEKIKSYPISFPVVMDYEWTSEVSSLSAKNRTDIALSFASVVSEAGYEPMLYVPIKELEDTTLWEKERVMEKMMVWGALYDGEVYPEKNHPDESTSFAMWQYSNTGRKAGIYGNVDLDVSYFKRERQEAKG